MQKKGKFPANNLQTTNPIVKYSQCFINPVSVHLSAPLLSVSTPTTEIVSSDEQGDQFPVVFKVYIGIILHAINKSTGLPRQITE